MFFNQHISMYYHTYHNTYHAHHGDRDMLSVSISFLKYVVYSCSSADEDDLDPDTKAARERERRQANNVRERCDPPYTPHLTLLPPPLKTMRGVMLVYWTKKYLRKKYKMGMFARWRSHCWISMLKFHRKLTLTSLTLFLIEFSLVWIHFESVSRKFFKIIFVFWKTLLYKL